MNPIVKALLAAVRAAPQENRDEVEDAISAYKVRFEASYNAFKHYSRFITELLDGLEEMLDVR